MSLYIRKTYYPKTQRVTDSGAKVVVTEKLDGSNIGFANVAGKLNIFQRNTAFKFEDLEEVKGITYKGLYEWLKTHGEELEEQLHDGSVIFGEWIGMAHIKYPEDFGRFHMFAKANYDYATDTVVNILYNKHLFVYPFKDVEIPDFIKVVPVVKELDKYPTVKELDDIYEEYIKTKDHDVEGFIVIQGDREITKYVRIKGGKVQEHYQGK